MFAATWIFTTLAAAGTQTLRNGLQRSLTVEVGTLGATWVRFLFGLPFAGLFLLTAVALTGEMPAPQPEFWAWAAAGGLAQIGATACMLHAMRDRSFLVTIAYTKTEPVQVALISLALIGEVPTPHLAAAIAVATLGVMILSWPKRAGGGGLVAGERAPRRVDHLRPALLGIASGGLFGLSAVLFKSAIRTAGATDVLLAATAALAAALLVQTAGLTAWIAATDPRVLAAVVRRWKPSLAAGALGAAASQLWFYAFATAPVAAVRTLGLVEILFAQALSRGAFEERSSRREILGIALLALGVALVLAS